MIKQTGHVKQHCVDPFNSTTPEQPAKGQSQKLLTPLIQAAECPIGTKL